MRVLYLSDLSIAYPKRYHFANLQPAFFAEIPIEQLHECPFLLTAAQPIVHLQVLQVPHHLLLEGRWQLQLHHLLAGQLVLKPLQVTAL